jgi:transglutaminase-like putative cysteine protease
MIRYQISHRTVYDYESIVSSGHYLAHLAPRPHDWQRCENISLTTDPAPAFTEFGQDEHGNRFDAFEIHTPHQHLEVTVASQVTIDREEAPQPGAPTTAGTWESAAADLSRCLDPDLRAAYPFSLPSSMIPLLPQVSEWVAPSLQPGRPLLDLALELNQRIFDEFTYASGATDIATPLATVIETKLGVCQDFAHLLLAAFRSLGLAARYVSGYLETDPPPGGVRLVGVDASHAWVSVHLPYHGWLDLDPTNGCIAGDRHLTVAWGRDFADVSPLKGLVVGGGRHALSVGVDVVRI